MIQKEKKEKRILLLSFFAGLLFAVGELVFAIFSRSHSVLMDAVYDSAELLFIALIIFMTPLFYKPVSEEHPYGFFQVESIFLIIKSVMMLSVTLGVAIEVIQSALSGGNTVDNVQISVFQLFVCLCCLVIYLLMRRMSRKMNSPMIQSELLEWRIDIAYSGGMSLAFFASSFLEGTRLDFLRPYVDPVIAVAVMLLTLPECFRILCRAVKDISLFPPDPDTVEGIREACTQMLSSTHLNPVSFDIIRTGRHIWVTVYFETPDKALQVSDLRRITGDLNTAVKSRFRNCTCELILDT